jgi:hypothetical protein
MRKIDQVYLVINGKEVFIDRYARELNIVFDVKGSILYTKQLSRKRCEVGWLEKISIEEFLHDHNDLSRGNVYYDNIDDIYKIKLDQKIISELYDKNKCLSSEELCLGYQYLISNNLNAFYTICLVDPDELQDDKYLNYDFVIKNTLDMYPKLSNYKLTLKTKKK